MTAMTRWERVRAAAAGSEVDRPPFGLWRHFYEAEETASGLYRAMRTWQQAYGWDFLKVNPRAQYHVEGWGVTYHYSGLSEHPIRTRYPIHSTGDLAELRPQDLDSPALAEQLDVISRLARDFEGKVPFIQTIFSPLSIVADLCADDDALVEMLGHSPDAVEHALRVVTDTFSRFAKACLDAGASGIFYATTTWATRNRMPYAAYERFGRPYDLAVLHAVEDAPFNVLHVCSTQSFVSELADYPVQVINWAAGAPGNLNLAGFRERMPGRAMMGGLPDSVLAASSPEMVRTAVMNALQVTGGRHLLLAGDCSISADSRPSNFGAAASVLAGGR